MKLWMKTSALSTPPEIIRGGLVGYMKGGDHFPEKIPKKEETKRKPSRPCFVLNGSREDMKKKDC